MSAQQDKIDRSRRELARNGLAGSIAISVAVGSFNPLDTLRIRWQVAPQSSSISLVQYAQQIVKIEGLVKGLWTPGLGANMASFFVCGGLRQGFYPFFRDSLVVILGQEEKSVATMMLGGFATGAIAFWSCTPFFQLKTLMQAEAGRIEQGLDGQRVLRTGSRAGSAPRFHGRMWWENGAQLAAEGGFSTLWRGASPLVVRGSLLAAGQMLGYDGVKTYCKKNDVLSDGPVLHVGASVAAAFFSCSFSAPADIVMTRYQAAVVMGRSYDGPIHCVRTMLTEEGVGVLFRGWTPFFVRVTPLFAINLPLYEQIRRCLGIGYLD